MCSHKHGAPVSFVGAHVFSRPQQLAASNHTDGLNQLLIYIHFGNPTFLFYPNYNQQPPPPPPRRRLCLSVVPMFGNLYPESPCFVFLELDKSGREKFE